jgi:hypothetical protein
MKITNRILKISFFIILLLGLSSPNADANCNSVECDSFLGSRQGAVYISDKDPQLGFGALGDDVWVFIVFNKGNYQHRYSTTKPKVSKKGKNWYIQIPVEN